MRLTALPLIVAALVGSASAQVRIACAPSPVEFSRSIFDHRTAKHIQHVSCVIDNREPGPVVVSESEVQGWLIRQGVTALSGDIVRIGSEEMKRRGWKATAGRVAVHLSTIAAVLAASEVIQIGPAWGAAVGFGALQLPTLGEALRQREPDVRHFDSVRVQDDLEIGQGESRSVSLFAVRGDYGPVHGDLRSAAPMGLPAVVIESHREPDLWRMARYQQMAAPAAVAPVDLTRTRAVLLIAD